MAGGEGEGYGRHGEGLQREGWKHRGILLYGQVPLRAAILAIERFEGKDYCQTCYFEKVREDQEAEQRKGHRAKYHR